MAKKKRSYRRRYRRYRAVRWAQYNVFRTKCEWSSIISFPENDGQPVITGAGVNGQDVSFISLSELLKKYPKNDSLRSMFSYVTITGVRVEVIPHSLNTATSLTQQYPVAFAYVSGTNNNPDNITFNDLQSVNSSIILDPSNRQTRYWPLKGAQFDLKLAADTNASAAGVFKILSLANGQYSKTPGWNVKITLYCYWRYAKYL